MSEHPTKETTAEEIARRHYRKDHFISQSVAERAYFLVLAQSLQRGQTIARLSRIVGKLRKRLRVERASSLAPVAPVQTDDEWARRFCVCDETHTCVYHSQLAARDRVAPPSGAQLSPAVVHMLSEPDLAVTVNPDGSCSPLPRSTEGEALTALIAKWRKSSGWDHESGAAFLEAANELDALVRASSPPPPMSADDGFDVRTLAAEFGWTYQGSVTDWLRGELNNLLDLRPVPPSASGPSKERSVPLRQTHYDCGCRIQGGVGVPGCSECTEPGLRS